MTSPPDLVEALRRMGLVADDQSAVLEPLAGGVSSDIYRVRLPDGRLVCVKRALAKLKVTADWYAPVDRNRNELDYLRVAGMIVPGAFPQVLGDDPPSGSFAMEYLAPDEYPVWKTELAAGRVDPVAARAVGALLARVHAATAGDPAIARRFATDGNFDALRLDPYLLATARRHPDLAGELGALVSATRSERRVLVHGDFSPKNILIGARGALVLDAECAWYGDPAFDLAFVSTHLLLKCLWRPEARHRLHAALDALVDAYSAGIRWEPAVDVLRRTAALVPGLMLARVDGKSPVEYLVDERDRNFVRRFTREALLHAHADPRRLAAAWIAALLAHA